MNIKKIVAKEGLILIAIGIAVYFLVLFFCRNIPVVFAKYKVNFANGAVYIIDIYPDLDYSKVFNAGLFLKEIHNPPAKLVSKRIAEFSKRANINSSLKNAYCINSWQLYLSEACYRILALNLFVKILFVYLFLLAVRFTAWAIRTLKLTSRL